MMESGSMSARDNATQDGQRNTNLPISDPQQFLGLFKQSMTTYNFGLNPLAAELIWAVNELQMRRNILGNIAEIGVAYGASALFLYQIRRPNEILYLNDIFEAAQLNISASGDNRPTIESIRRTFQRTVGTTDQVIFINKPSQQLTADEMSHIRIFHIDGGHSYDEVIADLRYAKEALNPQGAIVVDDMGTDTGWRSVYYATRDFLHATGLDAQYFVPHFSNKAVIIPDRLLFEELYDLYQQASRSGKADRQRSFNLSSESFLPYWQPSTFMQVFAPLNTRVVSKVRRTAERLSRRPARLTNQ